jgi:hypothetical protein
LEGEEICVKILYSLAGTSGKILEEMSGLSNQYFNIDANSMRNPSRSLHVKDCKNIFDIGVGEKSMIDSS